jgi:hypothetical protein
MNGITGSQRDDNSPDQPGPPPLPPSPYFSTPQLESPKLPPPIPPWPAAASSRITPPQYVLNPTSRRTDVSSWSSALILCCLVLGFLAAIAQFERTRYGDELQRASHLATNVELFQGDQETFGRNLSDPHTMLIHLSGFASTDGHAAALAFNLSLRWGALLCDQLTKLPDDQHYEVWALWNGDPANATLLAVLDSQPGVSVYPFHFQNQVVSADRIEITAGPRSGQAPVLSGDVTR